MRTGCFDAIISLLNTILGHVDDIETHYVPEQQADAILSQANPVSGTYYTVLSSTAHVRIISIVGDVTWAVTQPTPLYFRVVIDGVSFVFYRINPVSATSYFCALYANAAENNQSISNIDFSSRPFLFEGRSVKAETSVTWAVTQPTPLVCRVRYAKW